MDAIWHGMLGNGEMLVLGAQMRDTVERARTLHHTSPAATAALGRVLCACGMMSALLKNDTDSITVTVHGDGPLGRIVAVGQRGVHVKGYVENPFCPSELREDGKLDVGAAVGRTGRMTVVRDLGLREPYIGQIPLVSGEIAEDFAQYFLTSEQQMSAVSLGVRLTPEGEVLSAGGVILQRMPGCTEETLCAVEERLSDFVDISRPLAEGMDIETLLHIAFAGLPFELLEPMDASFTCDCSQAKVERALIGVGREELEDMIARDHGANLTCHFCTKAYNFDEDALKRLLREAGA